MHTSAKFEGRANKASKRLIEFIHVELGQNCTLQTNKYKISCATNYFTGGQVYSLFYLSDRFVSESMIPRVLFFPRMMT